MSSSGKWSAGTKMRTKLTAVQVQDIRILYNRGDCTQGQLSRDFGVSVIQIGRIVRNEVWQNLPPPTPTNREIAEQAERLLQVQAEVSGMTKLQDEADRILGQGRQIIDALDEED